MNAAELAEARNTVTTFAFPAVADDKKRVVDWYRSTRRWTRGIADAAKKAGVNKAWVVAEANR